MTHNTMSYFLVIIALHLITLGLPNEDNKLHP